MTKIILFIYAFLLIFVPVFTTFAYTTGSGIVPICNKGALQKVEVKDASGVLIKDANGNPIYDYQLGATKCDFTQVINLANSVIDFLLFYIASPIAALIFCYAGFKLLTSGGSEEALTKAKKMLMTMVKGYVIALIAWLVIHSLVTGLGFPESGTFLQR